MPWLCLKRYPASGKHWLEVSGHLQFTTAGAMYFDFELPAQSRSGRMRRRGFTGMSACLPKTHNVFPAEPLLSCCHGSHRSSRGRPALNDMQHGADSVGQLATVGKDVVAGSTSQKGESAVFPTQPEFWLVAVLLIFTLCGKPAPGTRPPDLETRPSRSPCFPRSGELEKLVDEVRANACRSV